MIQFANVCIHNIILEFMACRDVKVILELYKCNIWVICDNYSFSIKPCSVHMSHVHKRAHGCDQGEVSLIHANTKGRRHLSFGIIYT